MNVIGVLLVAGALALIGLGYLWATWPADRVAKLLRNGSFLGFGLLAVALFVLRLPILALVSGIIAVSLWRRTAARLQEDLRARARRPSSNIDRQQALALLGLQDGASREEVQKAYKAKMKEHHPDNGGDPEIASRLNAARDLLLSQK